MNAISRRKFFKNGFALAALAGFGAPRLNKVAFSRLGGGGPERFLPDPISKTRLGPFFGTQTHFGQHRAGVEELLGLIKEAGIGWIRDEVYWGEVEKEKGVFRFPPDYDQYLRAAQAHGIQVLLILDFSNALYSGAEKAAPATEAERLAFARYCREVIKRYKTFGVRNYEIWNEPNGSLFWNPQPNPEDYAKLLQTAYRACKDADAGATMLGCSTAGTDLNFIGRVLDAGGGRSMDAVSFHPYCQPLPPEKRLLSDISKLKALAPGKPLWITEFGYTSYAGGGGIHAETQANYMVRALLLTATSPAMERIFWYDFQNDGEDIKEPELNFGLIRKDKTPKIAFRAFRTMTSLVTDFPPPELQIIGNTYILRFEKGKDRLIAAWRLSGTESTAIPCPNGLYRLIERDGESLTVEAKESILEISVSEKPRYIQPAGIPV